MAERGIPLPKFGEWDVNDPASAEGFTVIFNKARDEKGQVESVTLHQRMNQHISMDQPWESHSLRNGFAACNPLQQNHEQLVAGYASMPKITYLNLSWNNGGSCQAVTMCWNFLLL